MNIHTRRTIALLFITIFFIGTPILLLYTSGYRYNFKKGDIQKTGALVIETTPKNATIFLSGQKQPATTPTRLNNLLPDEYEITVEKENHYPWQKKLSVASQKTTFAEKIVLFKKTSPTPIYEDDIIWSDFNNKKFSLFTTKDKDLTHLFLLDNQKEKTRLLLSTKTQNPQWQVFWDHKSNSFLVLNDSNSWLINIGITKNIQELKIPAEKIKNVRFVNGIPYFFIDNHIYILKESELQPFYLSPKEELLIDFWVDSDKIFFIKKIGNNTVLRLEPLPGNSSIIPKDLTLQGDDKKILDKISNKILLYEKNDATFYLIDESLENVSLIKHDFLGYDFLPQLNKILIYTETEISELFWGYKTEEKVLTRYSSGIKKVLWHNSGEYILILQNEKMTVFENDHRNGHFQLSLPISNLTDFSIDETSKNLIFRETNKIMNYQLQ